MSATILAPLKNIELTEEHETGCFLNGKPIYEKYVKGTVTSSSYSGWYFCIDVSNLNIEHGISCYGTIDNNLILPYADSSNSVYLAFWYNHQWIAIQSNNISYWYNKPIEVLIQYTKK